jgi:proline dehydrogenase
MGLLDRLIVWTLPFVPKPLVRYFSKKYVAGETLEDALTLVRQFHRDGYLCTLDVLGEFIHTPAEAEAAAQLYKDILTTLSEEGLNTSVNVSVKPTQMGLLLDKELCYSILRDLAVTAQAHGNFVRVEMEDSQCTSDTIEVYLRLREEFSNVGLVLQAYMRRTLKDAQRIMAAGGGHFRLCKGIYIEPRTVAYKERGLINRNYVRVLEEMFRQGAYVGIATHDETLVWEAERLIEQYQLAPEAYEFQMLLGVDEELRGLIRENGHRLRVYVPFGEHWYAYCVRRLRENPTIARYALNSLLKNFFKREKRQAPPPQTFAVPALSLKP